MSDSIIIYRNPMEKAMWESNCLPAVICGGAACVFVIVIGMWLSNKIYGRGYGTNNPRDIFQKMVVGAGFAAMFVIMWLMM